MPPTPEQHDYINVRWSQLNTLSKEASDKAMSFLMVTNAGGAVATLSFLGAVKEMRLQWAPQMALFLFILGVILVGVHAAIWVHRIENLYRHWRTDATRFITDQLTWQVLTDDDDERSYSGIWKFYAVGYLSFACFIFGAIIGLCFTHF
jgi:hypothetical protein